MSQDRPYDTIQEDIVHIKLHIIYDIDNDTFEIKGNALYPKNTVKNFLRTQIGTGKDFSPPNNKSKYNIVIDLDLTDDTFYIQDDCGNKGVRDGILLRFCEKYE